MASSKEQAFSGREKQAPKRKRAEAAPVDQAREERERVSLVCDGLLQERRRVSDEKASVAQQVGNEAQALTKQRAAKKLDARQARKRELKAAAQQLLAGRSHGAAAKSRRRPAGTVSFDI
ncbi:hypothetical protein T492DRAFT_1059165 [Pavlovales sp. CCMP2436]|nr:hypothetical protein T492DRAFT_1059165 [Pavlovales sp. CCMP2436]|mmetsp:Transcript_16584/g.42334  ORF Transcript_16584/g.42334 Transcript_16584/m.42334 type:complete len:120 (+) Transcript_16584:85-444(+)